MSKRKFIPIAHPSIGKEEEKAVMAVLKSGHLAQGEQVEKFESEFAKFCNIKYAAAVANGTCALHLALLACGIGSGDEVITTPFSFIASSNAIKFVGATPVFVDIEKDSFNIDPEKIEEKITPRTKAIIPVHIFGNPAKMDRIINIAKKHGLLIIEDACQAHGATLEEKKVGTFGDAGCFSFYPTKNMTSGEGGMVVTNSKKIIDQVKLLRSHGMRERYVHEELGFNFRMSDIHAAIGIAQLKKLPEFNKKRKNIATRYDNLLAGIKGVVLPKMEEGGQRHQYSLIVPLTIRNKFIEFLKDKGIQTVVYYPNPIHRQSFYKNNTSCPVAEEVAKRIISLPIYPSLSSNDVSYICKTIASFFLQNTKHSRR